MYSGEALAFFLFVITIFLCLAQATAVIKKKNSGFPEGSRSFFYSADGQRARSEGSRAIKKKNNFSFFFFLAFGSLASRRLEYTKVRFNTVLRSEGAR